MAAGEVGVGNLGQAKFGHAVFLQGPTIAGRRSGVNHQVRQGTANGVGQARMEPDFN